MDVIQKVLLQFPLVAVVVYIWWNNRQDYLRSLNALKELLHQREKELERGYKIFEKMAVSLEIIKDRLPR